jgi:caa(3)-type oxidase subunit IV
MDLFIPSFVYSKIRKMSEHEEHAHINYIKIYFILLALFVVSIVGPEIGTKLGSKTITLITAFGIAGVKAYLVCAYFMHLKFELRMISLMLISCVGFLFLFFIGVAPDVMQKKGSNWNTTIKVTAEKEAPHESHHSGADTHESDKGHNSHDHSNHQH